jgi:HrpA-like RNA helicase
MPTLIEKGRITFLCRELTKREKDINERERALDFINLYFFDKYVPKSRGGTPLIKPKKPGDRIKIMLADTGAGKSSIGPELYINHYDAIPKNIAVLQPTITTAISIPDDVLGVPEYGEIFTMGENIGYQTGTFINKPTRGIVFMTTGVIGQMLKVMTDEDFMKKFSFVILDEAHMRRIELDMVFFLMKRLNARQLNNVDCPFVIAMSATMPAVRYADYFKTPRNDIISVPGQTFPKTRIFLDGAVSDYIKTATDTALKIHAADADGIERGDILIFVYGAAAMSKMSEIFEKALTTTPKKFVLTKLSAEDFTVGSSSYFNVFRPLTLQPMDGEIPTRRIILGTPAVETGLSLKTTKYCIETGYFTAVEYNPIYGLTMVARKPVTQSMALQRIGRVGRKFPGIFHAMYTEDDFKEMDIDQKPDIHKADMTQLLFQLIADATISPKWDKKMATWDAARFITGGFKFTDIDLLDYPNTDNMAAALEKLFVLGFINGRAEPTTMGVASQHFRLRYENIRMIFEAYCVGANVADVMTLAAILEQKAGDLINTVEMMGPVFKPRNVFGGDLNPTERKLIKRLNIADDPIELLFAFYDFRDQIMAGGDVCKWCVDNGMKYEGWLAVITIRDEIMKSMVSGVGLDPFYNGKKMEQYDLREVIQYDCGEINKIKMCLLEGWRLNTATWNDSVGSFIMDQSHVAITTKAPAVMPLHGSSGKVFPRYIIVYDLTLKLPSRSTLYDYSATIASVLDGFIAHDRELVNS